MILSKMIHAVNHNDQLCISIRLRQCTRCHIWNSGHNKDGDGGICIAWSDGNKYQFKYQYMSPMQLIESNE